MSIKRTATLEDQFRSMHLGDNEQDLLLLGLGTAHRIIPCEERGSSTLESTASKLTRVIKEAFVDGDDEEVRPLMDFDEPAVELTLREIVDLTVQTIDRSTIQGISIKDLEVLKQTHPNIREAVFSTINREAKEVFDVSSWVHLEKLSFKCFDLTEKELKFLSKSKSITHLDLDYPQKELTSREWGYIGSFKNLESLTLRRYLITDEQVLDILKSGKKIRHLKLVNCRRISPEIIRKISSFTQLMSLQLYLLGKSEQSMVEPLNRLSKLEDLELSGNWLNIESLRCLTNLKHLALHASDIEDTQLAEIITDLAHLERLTLTKSCKLTNGAIIAIGKHLTKLHHLDFSDSININDLTPLASLRWLKYLNLSGCLKIVNLDILKSLDELEYLNLKSSYLNDYSFIAFLGNLKHLNLSFCDIDNMNFLSNLQQLEHLNVSQSFYKKVLDLSLIPIHLDKFKQLLISQEDKIQGFKRLHRDLQKKIKQEFIPSHRRDYI